MSDIYGKSDAQLLAKIRSLERDLQELEKSTVSSTVEECTEKGPEVTNKDFLQDKSNIDHDIPKSPGQYFHGDYDDNFNNIDEEEDSSKNGMSDESESPPPDKDDHDACEGESEEIRAFKEKVRRANPPIERVISVILSASLENQDGDDNTPLQLPPKQSSPNNPDLETIGSSGNQEKQEAEINVNYTTRFWRKICSTPVKKKSFDPQPLMKGNSSSKEVFVRKAHKARIGKLLERKKTKEEKKFLRRTKKYFGIGEREPTQNKKEKRKRFHKNSDMIDGRKLILTSDNKIVEVEPDKSKKVVGVHDNDNVSPFPVPPKSSPTEKKTITLKEKELIDDLIQFAENQGFFDDPTIQSCGTDSQPLMDSEPTLQDAPDFGLPSFDVSLFL